MTSPESGSSDAGTGSDQVESQVDTSSGSATDDALNNLDSSEKSSTDGSSDTGESQGDSSSDSSSEDAANNLDGSDEGSIDGSTDAGEAQDDLTIDEFKIIDLPKDFPPEPFWPDPFESAEPGKGQESVPVECNDDDAAVESPYNLEPSAHKDKPTGDKSPDRPMDSPESNSAAPRENELVETTEIPEILPDAPQTPPDATKPIEKIQPSQKAPDKPESPSVTTGENELLETTEIPEILPDAPQTPLYATEENKPGEKAQPVQKAPDALDLTISRSPKDWEEIKKFADELNFNITKSSWEEFNKNNIEKGRKIVLRIPLQNKELPTLEELEKAEKKVPNPKEKDNTDFEKRYQSALERASGGKWVKLKVGRLWTDIKHFFGDKINKRKGKEILSDEEYLKSFSKWESESGNYHRSYRDFEAFEKECNCTIDANDKWMRNFLQNSRSMGDSRG